MERNKRIIKISITSIITNLFLVIIKIIIGLIANSIAIILDGVNNLSDTISSIVTIIGTKLSAKKPDKKHPYGYGRIEYFSSVIVALLIMLAGIIAFKESVIKIINPVTSTYNTLTLIIISIAIIVKNVLGYYVKKQGEKLNSQSLIASGIDALNDSMISFSTIVAAIVSLALGLSIEGYVGVLISTFILKEAYSILKATIDEMIGVRADKSLTTKLRKRINSYEEVLGVYDLILHNYGPNNLIGTAHIEINDKMTAKEIHKLTREIIFDVYNKFGIVMTIGIYAANDSGIYSEIKSKISKLHKKYKSILQTHGFYVDTETKTISFDAIFSFDEQNMDEIVKEITTNLKTEYPGYEFLILIDKDYTD